MNTAKDIAEELYRSFKSQVLWKDVDFKRIDKFEKIIKRRFALELDAQVKKAVEEHIANKPVVEDQPEELIQIEHQTLLQRIVMDQDNQLIQDIIQTEPTVKPEEKVEQFNSIVEGAVEKRYHVKITCTGIKKKPNFQIFKGSDVIEKDFKSDAILSHKYVYFAYVDTFDRKEIDKVIPDYFINAYISDVYETTFDEIPVNYKAVWQNRTKL